MDKCVGVLFYLDENNILQFYEVNQIGFIFDITFPCKVFLLGFYSQVKNKLIISISTGFASFEVAFFVANGGYLGSGCVAVDIRYFRKQNSSIQLDLS